MDPLGLDSEKPGKETLLDVSGVKTKGKEPAVEKGDENATQEASKGQSADVIASDTVPAQDSESSAMPIRPRAPALLRKLQRSSA